MKSIQLLLIVAALLFITSFPVAAQPYGISEEGQEFVTNPVTPQRADPWVYKHTDGYYYFTGSVPAYDRIELRRDRKSTRLNSSHVAISYAVFCLKKKTKAS